MKTVPPLKRPWGDADSPSQPQGCYLPTRPNGKRVPGWSDVNVTQLAGDIGVSFRYLLGVLSGRRNCTLNLLRQTAQALGISLTVLIERIELACALRAGLAPVDKTERRRERSKRRVLQLARRH
jgi:transcriptional regulator with XRE-family HTH domain